MRVPSGARRQSGVLVVPQLEHCWPDLISLKEVVRLFSGSFSSFLMAAGGSGCRGDVGDGSWVGWEFSPSVGSKETDIATFMK